MIRTQVYLTEEQKRDIELRARRERKQEAEVIRELIDQGRNALEEKEPHETAGKALLRLASIGAHGPADLSSRIDDYLYGEDD